MGGALQKAGQQAPQREQQLAEAQTQQQQALDAMREAANKMNTANENLYARNFYNRMRAAASAEHKISDGLKTLAKATIGLTPDEIGGEQKQNFDNAAGKQDTTTKDVDGIANDMANFVKRVPNEKYEAVHKEMQEKKVIAELTELSGFVRAALGLKSVTRAKQWGDQLNEWATMLQSECKSQGGDGEMDPDMLELIVAMVRAAQAQDNIREQTGLLEAKKDENPQYPEDAKKLAEQQIELGDSIYMLAKKTKFDDVKPLLKQVETLMEEVTLALQKPKTDAEVASTEGMIIELLVPPDKKGGKSASMAKMQSMMQQMMAQATQARTAGRNNQKSTSDLAGGAAEGASGRDKANARNVEKAGGASSSGEWPEEYRDLLQSFFQATEESGK